MTDPETDDAEIPVESILVTADAAHEAAVELVIPAPVYESIATENFPRAEILPVPADSRVIDGIAGLDRKLDALKAQFDREIRAEATREKVVDRLHAELQDYKNDLLLNILRPVFIDLIQLHDDVGKMGARDETAPPATDVESIQQAIEDILYRQGVEPFVSEADAFDARRQRAVSTVPTDDPALARQVATRHRKGFARGEKVIRPEVVSVYTLRRPTTTVS